MKTFRFYYIILSGVLLVSVMSYATTNPCRLKAELERPSIALGEKDEISLTLRNMGHFPVRISSGERGGAGVDYYITMTRLDGLVPEKTIYYKGLTYEPLTPAEELMLPVLAPQKIDWDMQSGDTMVKSIDVNDLFIIKKPGIYKLRAARNIPGTINPVPNSEPGQTVIYSNTVTLVVHQ